MNNQTTISQEVYDLSPDQLGIALYHIANRTDVALSYTQRFVRDVQNRISSLLCNAIVLEDLTPSLLDVLNETLYEPADDIIDELEPDDPEYNQPFDPELQAILDEMNGTRVRSCLYDPSLTCNCTPIEALKCAGKRPIWWDQIDL